MRHASRVLLVLLLFLSACPDRSEPSSPALPGAEDPPPRPLVDEAFIKRAFNPDALPANKALLLELDPAPGVEAVVTVDLGNRNYQIAVVRGNHQVLSRAPLGGKILSHANVQRIGSFKHLEVGPKKRPLVMLPVATLVQRQWVCGVLLFGYRAESLILVSELGTRCWNREAVGKGHDLDPYSVIQFSEEDGEPRMAITEDLGVRTYRWDETKGAHAAVGYKKKR